MNVYVVFTMKNITKKSWIKQFNDNEKRKKKKSISF